MPIDIYYISAFSLAFTTNEYFEFQCESVRLQYVMPICMLKQWQLNRVTLLLLLCVFLLSYDSLIDTNSK